MDKKLTLPDFLKLLTSNNVPVPKTMAVASKVFKEYNTPALLSQLDDNKLQVLDVKDKDLRKHVLAAIRGAGYIRLIRKPDSEGDHLEGCASSSKSPTTVQTLISPKKKRKHDDLNVFLPEAPPDEGSTYGSMDFNEVLDEGILKSKSTVVNRAPLMTAWATIVAERLGFDREEALSIGSVYTEMNAVAKGVSLGIIDQSKEKKIEHSSNDSQQPYVDLMGRRPLYKTQSSKWRALVGGSPSVPSAAFSYISRAFRQTTPNIVGALRLLAESYPPQELNRVGFSLYADLRPTVDGWGKRGEVRCEHILSLRKKGVGKTLEGSVSNIGNDIQEEPVVDHHLPKRVRETSPDEYEAAFDDDLELDQETLSKLP